MAMAFNSWDKLTKAQHEYPKPKFASAVVEKALKKQPKNPYLLAWKEDLALQQCLEPGAIAHRLMEIHGLSILDTQLLAYMYRLTIEAYRRHLQEAFPLSAETRVISCWQRLAKTLKRKEDRMLLWNELFKVALQDYIWEDVRIAIVNYKKEAPPSEKKNIHYSLIFASLQTQRQHQQSIYLKNVLKPRVSIQADVALAMLRQAYRAAPDDAIAVKDITDLRFMADIHCELDRTQELQELWDDPPEHLRTAMLHNHREDVQSVIMRVLLARKQWPQLEEHCRRTLMETVSLLKVESPDSSSELSQLCGRRVATWSSLMEATSENNTPAGALEIVKDLMERVLGTSAYSRARDRPTRIVRMLLQDFIGRNPRDTCEDYFQDFCRMASCFEDLRPHVQRLTPEEAQLFFNFSCAKLKEIQDVPWDALPIVNFYKFAYYFYVSRAMLEPAVHTFESQFEQNITLLAVCNHVDLGYLACYILLNIHHSFVCQSEGRNPLERRHNSRILLQAAMCARHIVEQDKQKQNRTFALFAARLHLNLGLGLVAFQLYRHTNNKEMLLDTLSLYMFSRISQTHPFGVQSYRGFSADEELAKTISTIERMESKTRSLLVTDISSFRPHQAQNMIDLRMKLQGSLTKHICCMERRRIARLKGEPSDRLPRLDWNSYSLISDNTDRDIFPSFESKEWTYRHLDLAMPSGLPTLDWYIDTHLSREHVCQRLHNEVPSFSAQLDPYDESLLQKYECRSQYTRIERRMAGYWDALSVFLEQIHKPLAGPDAITTSDFVAYQEHIRNMRKALEKLRMPGNTTLEAEDEPTMFHENMLMACYGKLEVLRGTNKFIEVLREMVLKTPKGDKPHAYKKKLPPKYDTELLEETQICYGAVRDVAQSYIDLILRRGVEAIKAQVRWGPTGEALKMFLNDEDMEFYAQEYVESALEAWKGVLKVKLK